MDRNTFNKIREVVYEKSGISLGEGKEALVNARISKRMRELGIEGHREYLKYVINDVNGDEIVHLLDAIATNVTSFFREPHHFDFLQEIMQRWVSEGQRRFRFWSAACSTGEEPYTIAMSLMDCVDVDSLDLRILATDISTKVLKRCLEGVYAEKHVENISRARIDRYFERSRGGDAPTYKIKDGLKKHILFKRLNLSSPPFPMNGPMDVVFCRNVMIYFDNKVRKALLDEIYRLLKPGGYLMVGHAESLTGMMCNLKPIVPSIYVKE